MHRTVPGAMLVVALLLGCEASPDPDDTGTQPGLDVPTDTGLDAVTGATKKILTDTHPGWADPRCWTCHQPDDHNDGKDPYLCIGCHGRNGAADGHGGTPPCATCHTPALLDPSHEAEGFPDPLSCQSCHPG